MTIYSMDDGTIVNTLKALVSWQEISRWNGNNHISVATGSQWEHQTLYKSSKGRYYIEHTSQWQGILPFAFYLTDIEAAQWLLTNEIDLPDDLKQFQQDIEE